jgi:hypothetical protein
MFVSRAEMEAETKESPKWVNDAKALGLSNKT